MSKIFVVPPKSDDWIRLTGDSLLKYLKDHKLAPQKATEPKTLYHIDALSHEVHECTVVGYINQWTTVIDIDGNLDCIHPDYLLEMQQGRKRNASSDSKISHTPIKQTTLSGNSDTRYCVFDVETPNHSNDRISSIGIAILQNGQIVDSTSYLVNPQVPFDAYNIQLTGIDSQTVKYAPTFLQVWEDIQPLFSHAVLVAHNAKFDLSVLRKTLAAYHIPAFSVKYLCTLELSKKTFRNLEKYRLNDICDYLEIPLDHHQADSDSLACANILQHIISTGVQVNNYIQSYDLDEHIKTYPLQDATYSQTSSKTTALNELLELLSNISAEGQLTLVEVSELTSWIDSHLELKNCDPFDRVFIALKSAMLDGFLAPHEKKELLALFQTIIDPISEFSDPVDNISVSGKQICLTGNFEKCSREKLQNQLEDMGAIIKTSVIKHLDYLIVGEHGSDAWCTSNYGTKIQAAIKLKESGLPIKIIRENDFFAALQTSFEVLDSSGNQASHVILSDDTASSDALINQTLEQRCFETIKACLKNSEYNSNKITLSLRTPNKMPPYYAIEMFGRTCFRFDGKIKRKFLISPMVRKHFEPFGFIPTETKDPKVWRAIL